MGAPSFVDADLNSIRVPGPRYGSLRQARAAAALRARLRGCPYFIFEDHVECRWSVSAVDDPAPGTTLVDTVRP